MKYLNTPTIVFIALMASILFSCSDSDSDDDGQGGTGGEVSSMAINLEECRQDSELILEDHSEGIDYIIDCNLEIRGSLIIQAGTTISFGSEAQITIDDDAFIKVLGTASKPVKFTSETKIAGAYRGIVVLSNDVRNTFEFCNIEYAGEASRNNTKGSIIIGSNNDKGKASFSNCTVKNSSSAGIVFMDDATILSFTDNEISVTKGSSMICELSQMSAIDVSNSFLDSDKFSGIELRNTSLRRTETTAINGVPVYFPNRSYIEGFLKIEAGSTMVMASDVSMTITGFSSASGRIVANGTSAKPIQIKGEEAIPGFWAGILLSSSTTNNSFNHVEMSDGGGRTIDCTWGCEAANLVVGGGAGIGGSATSITVNNSDFSNSAGCGVFVVKESSFINNGVTFSNNTKFNVCFE